MDLQLAGKVALVTGASRGIGKAVAETLAAEGMQVVLAARSRDPLASLAATLPTRSLVQAVDLRDPQAPAAVVAATLSEFGRLDVVVNNAGATVRGDFLTLRDEDWSDGFALKFFGAMRCCRAAWPHLQATQGNIVMIAGLGGRVGSAEFTIGGTVNAALLNLTKALADRGVQDGVRVNAINPGSIATERLQVRVRRLAEESDGDVTAATARLAHALRVGRFGDPLEIARVVAFLAAPLAGYCQGVILDVDGGQNRAL
jgi:NAD(P)-dependent dehydrogenase (short-subunit alcohol dehydrogenase family)